jgi:hypothetical protein
MTNLTGLCYANLNHLREASLSAYSSLNLSNPLPVEQLRCSSGAMQGQRDPDGADVED